MTRRGEDRCGVVRWPEDCTADWVRSSGRPTRIIVREMRPNSAKLTRRWEDLRCLRGLVRHILE